MGYFTTTSICILSFCIITYSYGSYTEDHCWKDYDGTKPSNALNAGIDKYGKIINIGQVLHGDWIIAGEVYNDRRVIIYEYHGVHVRTKNIKVLCSEHHERFQWIRTKNDRIKNLNKFLVIGGYEGDTYTVYIGRAWVDEEQHVGKIVCDPNCQQLIILNLRFEEFEILTYNAAASKMNTTQI